MSGLASSVDMKRYSEVGPPSSGGEGREDETSDWRVEGLPGFHLL